MNYIEQAESEFLKIFPAGANAPHEYAAAGFRALAKARDEMEAVKDMRDLKAAEVEKLKKAISAVYFAWNREDGQFNVVKMVNTIEAANIIASACGKREGKP